MSDSSHIFVFWFLVDSYQKTKISAVKFVYLKKDQARFGFLRKINKLDSWYFGLLVAIYQTPKDKNMRWTKHIFATCDLMTILQRYFSIYYIKSFNLVTSCNLVTVFVEIKSVTKSRLHFTYCYLHFVIVIMIEMKYVLF